MQSRAFEDTKHLEYSHRAPCDFLCTAIRQVHLTVNKPETVHVRVKWRLGSSNQCILGYTSVLSSFQSDASLRESPILPLWWMHLCCVLLLWVKQAVKRGYLLHLPKQYSISWQGLQHHVTIKGCDKCVWIGLRPWLGTSTIESRVITLKRVSVCFWDKGSVQKKLQEEAHISKAIIYC